MTLPAEANIENITATAATNDFDQAGIRIAIDAKAKATMRVCIALNMKKPIKS